MKFKVRNIFLIVFIVLLSVFQFGLLPSLSRDLSINLLLVIAIFVILDSTNKNVWWIVLLAGFLLDLFSPLPFGSMIIILGVVGIIIYFIHLYFFTNQSIYTIVSLGGAAVLLFRFFILLIEYFTMKINFAPVKILTEISIEVLLFALLFILSNLIKRKIYYG